MIYSRWKQMTWYACIATCVGGWRLAGVALCREIPLHRELLFRDFRGLNAKVAVYRGALCNGLIVL
jgi:hypothetical protein